MGISKLDERSCLLAYQSWFKSVHYTCFMKEWWKMLHQKQALGSFERSVCQYSWLTIWSTKICPTGRPRPVEQRPGISSILKGAIKGSEFPSSSMGHWFKEKCNLLLWAHLAVLYLFTCGEMLYRQTATLKSPPCIHTGGLKNEASLSLILGCLGSSVVT